MLRDYDGNERVPTGRPTGYRDEYAEQATKLCLLGATDSEIADFFGVSTRTIHRWKIDHDAFCHALKAGKDIADERVVRSLYQMATGFTFIEQQAFKIKTVKYRAGKRLMETEEVQTVDVERFQPPDKVAAIFWLKNRRKEDWRDKQEVEHSGRITSNNMTDDELAAIAAGSGPGTAEKA